MSFADPTLDPAASAAVLAVDPSRAAAIREALDAGKPVRPEITAFTSAIVAQKARGFRFEDIDPLWSASRLLDASEVEAVRGHAWRVGLPESASHDRGRSIDIDDLFAGSPVAARMCRAAATVSLCSTDLTAMVLLAVASAGVAWKAVGRCKNRVGGGHWICPPSLYIAAEVASGECKSLVRSQLATALERRAPKVVAWHKELAIVEGGRRKLAFIRKTEADKMSNKYAISDPELAQHWAKKAAEHEEELAKPVTKPPSWMQWGAVTPERFGQQGTLGGFVACFPDEGKDLLSKFLGEGGGREYVGPMLTAFSGEWYSHETISGETRGDRAKYNRFRATMFLPIQPGVLSPASQQDGALLARMAQRGLLARLLIGRPYRPTASERPALRKAAEEAQSDEVAVAELRAEFDALMRGIVEGEGDPNKGDEDAQRDPARLAEEVDVGRPHPLVPARPWVFEFDEDARAALLDFQNRTGDAAAPEGERSQPGIAEFNRRLGDHAHRLATLLAILEQGAIEGGGHVRGVHVARAVRLLDGYFVPHALGVHERAIFDPIGDDAAVVLDKIRTRGTCTLRTLRGLLPAGGRGWGKIKSTDRVTRLETAVEALVSAGRVVIEQGAKGSRVVKLIGE